MKRFMILAILLTIAVFVLPANADPIPKEVEVINTPDKAVPVQGEVQVTNTIDVDVTNTTGNPVPVTVTNPSASSAIIERIAREDGQVSSPAIDTKNDLVTLTGPGTFIAARLAIGGSSDTRKSTIGELVIDGRIIFQESFREIELQGLREFNYFGVVGNDGGTVGSSTISIGFPQPVKFESSLVLSATAKTTGVTLISATVIYGE